VSYILDALKKAERDRRRAHVPSLGTMHAAPPERRNVWPWVIGGLVAANVLGFAAVFVMRSGAPAPAMAPVVAAPAAVAAPAPAPAPTPAVAVAPAPTPAPVAAPTPAAPQVTPAPVTPTTVAAPTSGTRDAVAHDSTPAAARTRARVSSEPETLRLEVLVFSENAAERAAYINGQRYLEGQRVQGRLVVERIMRDGVVLVGEGKRIVLKQD
jgi:hypothetical protein